MMKKYLSLFFIVSYIILSAQTDLVRWALTSDGSVSYSASKISATAVGTSQNPISFNSQGMTLTGWNNTSVEHYRYFGFSVSSTNGSSLKISNLAFEQERLSDKIQNYTIRYYIAPNSDNVDDYDFFANKSTVLVNNESIASNPVKNIPLNITISGTQRLIIKFYTSGSDWGAGWRIKANTLKLTEEQATVPVANNDSYSVYKNTSTNFNILSNDTSGSTITGVTITQQPAHGTLTVNGTTNVTYVPTVGYEGTDSFKYKAVNATGPSNEATVSINVVAAVPVANNDSYNVYNSGNTSLNILSNDTSTLTITGISITQQPTHGTLTVNGTTNVTYKPTSATFTGADTFKYKVSNVTGDSNEATVSINIQQDPNTAVPVANNDSFTAYKNNESDFNVLSNDTSVLAINGVTVTQQPTHGTLIVNGTTSVTYKPETGYTGADSFKYKASNSTGLSNEATVNISVIENVNTPLTRWNNSSFEPSVYNTHINVGNITSTVSQSYVQNISISGYNAFQTSGWPDKNAVTVDKSKYIQFTISPKNGYKLNLSEFNFLCMSQGGDAKIKIDYSLSNSFTTFFNVLPETTVTSSMSTISLTNFSKPIATDGQVVYLRVYVYNTWNAFQILLRNGDNVGPAFIGNVEFSSTAPIAYDDTVANIVNNDIDINVLINDDYSNKITTLEFTQPSHGSATLNADKSINYVPAKDYIGADAFTYYITNEYGVSNSATVSINNGPSVTSPLIRWDNTNFTATSFQSFINSTTITSNGGTGIVLGGETNPKVFYVETQSGQDNTNFNSSRYIQFVLGNDSTNKTIEPKTFDYYAMGSNGAKYEIRYSKTSDFSSDVVVMSTGNVPTAYTAQNFTFDNGFKLAPGEKVYVRLYLYNSYYVQYKMQFITGGLGPEIGGIYYNLVNTSNDTIWLNAANPHWSNGTPTATKNAIIDTHYDTTTYGNFVSSNLTINTGGTLTVNTGGYLTVNGQILNNASATGFVIENNANLLQNGTAVNTGNITVKKSAVIPKMGYNYWSSPVIGQNLYQFSEGYNQASTTGTGTPWNRFYVYNEANDYFVTNISGDITLNSSSTFQPSRGYAIRGKNSFPDAVTTTTAATTFEFVGTPQNGEVSAYTLRWTNATHGYNMVGNPYPSNLSFDDLFAANSTKIYGVAYLWTNNDSQITTQQSGNYSGNNYALYNGTGGTSATYFGYNNKKPKDYFAVGQGFIVQAKAAGKNQPLVFNNSMRYAEDANFYNKGDEKASQKDRFWLEFKSPTNVNNEILIGYLQNATNGYDNDFDTELLSIGTDSFWSILDAKKLGIQAKQAPLVSDDVVKIAVKASVAGDYTISVTQKEGTFNTGQKIYLKDTYLNKLIEITDQPYVFYTNAGQYEDRFQVLYKSQETTLGVDDTDRKDIIIYKDIQNFIVSSKDNLDEVTLYDALGRLLFSFKNHQKQVMIDKTSLTDGLYIIKAKSGNTIVTKKVLK